MFAFRSCVLLLVLAALVALAGPRLSGASTREVPYVVRPGDTLWRLAAERYAGDPREGVWRISRRNGLEASGLQPGMVLYLPARGGDA